MSVRPASAFLTLLALLPLAAQTPGPELRDAIAALQRADFPAAERQLRAAVKSHPDDPWALSLLGAALDNLSRTAEADALHQRAVALAPRSPEILNNYATHLWLAGRQKEAAVVYRRIVAVDPAHFNANLQLSRLAIGEKDGAEALRCLDRLPAQQQSAPPALLSRLQALELAGEREQADALAGRLLGMARADAALAAAAGVALSGAGQFAAAEKFFEAALEKNPSDFDLLYDLGTAATRAGHYERARETLGAALRQQPRNVDALYALASAEYESRRYEAAAQLLARAAALDPQRADVLRLLAAASTDLGALEDASATWDRYLKLRPDDAAARRERGYTAVQRGRAEEGLPDLEWYVARHPEDAAGHYELGQAERARDLAKAMDQFTRALAIDPRYVPALSARGSLHYQQAEPEAAVKDLEAAAALRADDAVNLDRLGQAYQALDRTGDAVRVLRRAAELAPDDSKILLHLARALADAGDTDESKAVMERFRQLGPEKRSGVRAGFVEYLSLTGGQRHAAYRARLEEAMRARPEEAELKLQYMKLLLADGRGGEAVAAARALSAMRPGGAVLAGAGRALLDAGQYAAAQEILEQTKTAEGETDLAIATHLARAQNLEAGAAVAELEQALAAAPERPGLYRTAAGLLAGKGRPQDARRLLDRAAARFPQDREVLLPAAVAAALSGDAAAAEAALAAIQKRWPEWHAAWAARGMILAGAGRFEEARRALDTAIALGASNPEVYSSIREIDAGKGASPSYLLSFFR